MIQTLRLFQIGFRQITKDGMLLVLLPAPFFVGLLFKFGVPFINDILQDKFDVSLLEWYGLADGLLLCLTPMFVAMVASFLILEERDEGITAFYQITPSVGYSYLVARIGIPMTFSFMITVIAVEMFHISIISTFDILAGSLISAMTGIALSTAIVSIAENRVEGLAVSKITGVSLFGLVSIWIIPTPYMYFTAFLPSFWVGKLMLEGVTIVSFSLGILTCMIWIVMFSKKFLKRIS